MAGCGPGDSIVTNPGKCVAQDVSANIVGSWFDWLTMSGPPGNATVRSGWVCSLGIGDMRSSGTPESVHDRPTRIRQGGSGFRIKSGVTDQRCSNLIGSVLSRGIGCITTGLEVCSTVRPYVVMQSLAVDSAAFVGLSCPIPGTAEVSGGRRRRFGLEILELAKRNEK